jgi:polygalacturonase
VRHRLSLLILAAALRVSAVEIPTFSSAEFNVRDFGARGNGRNNDTGPINAAIEKCSSSGGGTVMFPAGVYSAASIHLRSNVRLLLDTEAVIAAAADGYDQPEPNPFDRFQDFGHSHFHNALLWGENIENFAIIGGRIDGTHLVEDDAAPGKGDKIIALKSSRRLLFQNIVHRKGAHFVYLLNDCDQVTIDHVAIQQSRDGINVVSCRDVVVRDCNITGCGDDAIALKSDYALGRKIALANITVTNCHLETAANALQIGSETVGDMRDVSFSRISIARAGKAAIGLTSADGAVIENIRYSEITIRNGACPIFVHVTNRLRSGDATRHIGTIHHVTISDLTSTDSKPRRDVPVSPAIIVGKAESPIESVTSKNVSVVSAGGGTKPAKWTLPEPRGHPHKAFAYAPAAALFVSDARGLRLENVQFSYERADARPSLVAINVDRLEVERLRAQKTGTETMHLQRVNKLLLRDSAPLLDQSVEEINELAF